MKQGAVVINSATIRDGRGRMTGSLMIDTLHRQSVQAAEDLNATVFIHPWDMQVDGRMAQYCLPWLVGRLWNYRCNVTR